MKYFLYISINRCISMEMKWGKRKRILTASGDLETLERDREGGVS